MVAFQNPGTTDAHINDSKLSKSKIGRVEYNFWNIKSALIHVVVPEYISLIIIRYVVHVLYT